MIFYILTPHKIDAHENDLSDFLADDLLSVIERADTKIATTEDHLGLLQKAYPTYHRYEIKVQKFDE